MSKKPKGKSDVKDSASKNTLNPTSGGGSGKHVESQTNEPNEQDVQRRDGQFTGAGEPGRQQK